MHRWGSGEPTVVFLHGLGASSRYWSKLGEISHNYQAIAPDLLGFGRSPKPDIRYDADARFYAWTFLVVIPAQAASGA